jgi:protein PET117
LRAHLSSPSAPSSSFISSNSPKKQCVHLLALSSTFNILFQFCNIKANATQKAMHKGVIRDMEQQRVKKERQLDFEMQKALEEEYRKVQNVRDGGAVLDKPR